MSKRKRDPIFAASEKMALIDVVERHYNIVESKKTDVVSIRNKTDEWRKVALEFNASSSIHPREWTVLKNCWENLKKRAKQQQTLRNQHFLGTGGGPPKKLYEEPAIERVLDLLQARVSGYVNCFDSDGTHILASESNDLNDNSGSHLPPETICPETDTTVIVDWSQYTPSMLRETKNPALCTSPYVQLCVDQPSSQPDIQNHIVTSPRVHTSASVAGTSRRRPILRRERETQSLALEKINTLKMANTHAEEEHDIKMRILRLQEDKEKQMLEQEKLKTKQELLKIGILEKQLSKLKE